VEVILVQFKNCKSFRYYIFGIVSVYLKTHIIREDT
jgi:hypothetical protein